MRDAFVGKRFLSRDHSSGMVSQMLVETLETDWQSSRVNQAEAAGSWVGISFLAGISKTG